MGFPEVLTYCQAHHALVDGAHVARFLEQLTHLCRHPEVVIDALPDGLG